MEARWLKGATVGSTPQSGALSVPAPQRIALQLPILVKQFITSLRTPGETDRGSSAPGQWSQGTRGANHGHDYGFRELDGERFGWAEVHLERSVVPRSAVVLENPWPLSWAASKDENLGGVGRARS